MTGSGTSRPPQALTSKTIEALEAGSTSRAVSIAGFALQRPGGPRGARRRQNMQDLTFRVKGAGVKRLSLGRFDDVSTSDPHANEQTHLPIKAARRWGLTLSPTKPRRATNTGVHSPLAN